MDLSTRVLQTHNYVFTLSPAVVEVLCSSFTLGRVHGERWVGPQNAHTYTHRHTPTTHYDSNTHTNAMQAEQDGGLRSFHNETGKGLLKSAIATCWIGTLAIWQHAYAHTHWRAHTYACISTYLQIDTCKRQWCITECLHMMCGNRHGWMDNEWIKRK